jgi:hypothetical protein
MPSALIKKSMPINIPVQRMFQERFKMQTWGFHFLEFYMLLWANNTNKAPDVEVSELHAFHVLELPKLIKMNIGCTDFSFHCQAFLGRGFAYLTVVYIFRCI